MKKSELKQIIKEEYSKVINETHGITDVLIISYLLMFLKYKDLTPRHLLNNLKLMAVDFSKFLSNYGYIINPEILEYKIQKLIDKISK
tara:strand:+ start:128 stop:391 length:264 start_codon:yes stop_codon:yes gene_type:complete